MKNTFTLSLVAALVVLATAAPIASASTIPAHPHGDRVDRGGDVQASSISETPSTNIAPENNSTNTTTTTTAPPTTTAPDGLTGERIVSLITSGEADAEADRITSWLASNASRLDSNQATVAYRWLLTRAASADGSVSGDALDSVAAQLHEDRARGVVRDVRESLPKESVDRLQARLDTLGAEWSVAVSGWLREQSSTKTTTTTPGPQPTTDGDQEARDSGGGRAVAAQIDAATTLRSIEYHKQNGTFVLVLDVETPRSVVVSDNLAAMKANKGTSGMSTAEIPQKRLYLDRGTTTIEFKAVEWRGKTAVTIATPGGAVSINNGVPVANPFGGSSGTTGWLGGASIVLVSFVGAAVYTIRNEGGEIQEAEP